MARDRFVPTIGEGIPAIRVTTAASIRQDRNHADRRMIVRIDLRRITLAAIHANARIGGSDQPPKEGSP
jgi:hypothetical protein